MAGLLMGLLVLDTELVTMPEALDTATDELDLSLYLKDGNYLRQSTVDDPSVTASRYSEESFNTVLDQNATLREMNAKLQGQVSELEREKTQTDQRAKAATARVSTLESEIANLKTAVAEAEARAQDIQSQCETKLRTAQADINTERSTYNQSRAGLNEMFDAMTKQLETEKLAREEMEADLVRLRAARTVAEKQAAEAEAKANQRQDTIDALRKQLNEVKGLNLKTLTGMQVRKEKGEKSVQKDS